MVNMLTGGIIIGDDQAGILLKFRVNYALFKMGENAIVAILAKAPISTAQIDKVLSDVRDT